MCYMCTQHSMKKKLKIFVANEMQFISTPSHFLESNTQKCDKAVEQQQ